MWLQNETTIHQISNKVNVSTYMPMHDLQQWEKHNTLKSAMKCILIYDTNIEKTNKIGTTDNTVCI